MTFIRRGSQLKCKCINGSQIPVKMVFCRVTTLFLATVRNAFDVFPHALNEKLEKVSRSYTYQEKTSGGRGGFSLCESLGRSQHGTDRPWLLYEHSGDRQVKKRLGTLLVRRSQNGRTMPERQIENRNRHAFLHMLT